MSSQSKCFAQEGERCKSLAPPRPTPTPKEGKWDIDGDELFKTSVFRSSLRPSGLRLVLTILATPTHRTPPCGLLFRDVGRVHTNDSLRGRWTGRGDTLSKVVRVSADELETDGAETERGKKEWDNTYHSWSSSVVPPGHTSRRTRPGPSVSSRPPEHSKGVTNPHMIPETPENRRGTQTERCLPRPGLVPTPYGFGGVVPVGAW